MARTEEQITRLVKYIEYSFKDDLNNSIIIKPEGAFKECGNFVAYFKKSNLESNRNKPKKIDYRLEITIRHILDNFDNACDDIVFSRYANTDDLDIAVRKCLTWLDEIEFNKGYGNFVKKNAELPNPFEYKEIMNDLWDCEYTINCAVCLEPTHTETACGHTLCLICWSKINRDCYLKNDREYFVEEIYPKCPCCRENIQYKDSID